MVSVQQFVDSIASAGNNPSEIRLRSDYCCKFSSRILRLGSNRDAASVALAASISCGRRRISAPPTN